VTALLVTALLVTALLVTALLVTALLVTALLVTALLVTALLVTALLVTALLVTALLVTAPSRPEARTGPGGSLIVWLIAVPVLGRPITERHQVTVGGRPCRGMTEATNRLLTHGPYG
jgi:hypothetical protein